MTDQPPLNRATRRGIKAAGRKTKVTAFPTSRAARGQTAAATANPNTPPPPRTSGTAPSLGSGSTDLDGLTSSDAELFAEIVDEAPADHAAQMFSGYKGKYGPLKTGIVSTYGLIGVTVQRSINAYDGMLIISQAEPIADAYIAWGKQDPRVMRVLLVLFGSPVALLVAAHMPIVAGIMANHGVSMMSLFSPVRAAQAPAGQAQPYPGTATPGANTTLPYVPAGPMAGANTTPPPLPVYAQDQAQEPAPIAQDSDGMLIYPDDLITADIEIALREAARQSGRPYTELRAEAATALAQQQLAQNGHHRGRTTAPGTLGAPVQRPE